MEILNKLNTTLCNCKTRRYLFVFSWFFIFAFIFFLNVKTPLLGDDYTYKLIFDSDQSIQNFSDVIKSQQIHYEIWGGRVVVHTIAQLLLQLPSIVIDIINSLAFIVLMLLIYLHINYKKPFSVSLLLGVFFLLWFLEPFAETILWITGSANYMWGSILILGFLLPYRFYGNKSDNSIFTSTLKALLMLLFGIIAGWTNENTGAGLLVITVLFILYYRRNNNQKLPIWFYTGLLGLIIGYLAMISAPGNAVRSHNVNIGLFTVVYNIFRHTQSLLNTLGIFNLITLFLIYIVYKQKKNNYKSVICKAFIFVIGALVSVYAMVLSPSFPERAWFGLIIFNIIALGILLVNIDLPNIKNLKYGFIVLAVLIFSFNLYDVLKEISFVDDTLKQREAFIIKSKEEGKQLIYIDRYNVRSKYAMPDPIYSEPLMPRYYGVEVKYRKSADTTD